MINIADKSNVIIRTYQFILLTIFIVSSSLEVKAQNCDKLKNELFTAEHEYQKSKLNNCSNENKVFCCSTNDPASCKSVYNAQLDYNKALAKVNMLEGVVGLSMAVNNSHKSIRNLSDSHLFEVNKKIDNFLQNFDKANILSQSLAYYDDGKGNKFNIWEDYKEKDQDVDAYLSIKCEDKTFTKFCSTLKSTNIHKDSLYKMLQDFALADFHMGYKSSERLSNYEYYTEYLKFKVDDKEALPLENLASNGEIAKILELKKLVSEYTDTKNQEKAQKILSLSKELQKIDMNFNKGITPKDNGTFNTFATNQFANNMTNISTVAGTLTGADQIKNNLKSGQESLDIELKSKEQEILKDYNKIKAKVGARCGDISSSDQLGTCLKKLCGINSFNESCKQDISADLLPLGLEQLTKNFANLNETQTLAKANQAMLDCMDKKTIETQSQCVNEQKDKLGSLMTNDIDEAKKELALAKKALDFINKGDPVKGLASKKFLTIKALEAGQCLSDDSKKSATALNSFCGFADLNEHSKTALALKSNVEEALIQYDYEAYKEFLAGTGQYAPTDNGKTGYDQMLEECKRNPNSSSVCQFYVNEEKQKTENERRRKEIYNKVSNEKYRYKEYYDGYEEDEEDESPSAFSYAMLGLTKGVVQNIPGAFSYLQTRQYHNRQMQMWDQNLKMQQYYYGAGANYHTYNMQVNYNDWYQDPSFNALGTSYYDPANNILNVPTIPVSWTSDNGNIYIPAQ